MVTLSTADSALKNVYLSVLRNELNNEIDPFLAIIEKTSQDVNGGKIRKLIPTGINGGIGAGTESASLPTAKGNNYLLFKSNLKNIFGRIDLTDKAVRASADESGAFVNLLNAEMEGLVEGAKHYFKRVLYGRGGGSIATATAVTVGSPVVTVDKVFCFNPGMVVNIFVDEIQDTTLNNTIISSVNYADSTITLNVNANQDMADASKVEFIEVGKTNLEIFGLEALCDFYSATSLYDVNRLNNPFMIGRRTTFNNSTFTFNNVIKAIDDQNLENNANIDMILAGFYARRQLQGLIANSKINSDVLNLHGGMKAISFNGVPIVTSRYCSDKNFFLVDSKQFTLHQLCDWEWLTNDKGQVLRQKEGYPTHTATLVKYCDLICNKPCTVTQAVLS